GAKMAVSFRGFDVNVYPIKHPNVYGDVWKQIDKVHSISIFLLEKAYVLGLPKETPFKIINPAVALQHIPNKKVSKNNNPIKIITVARLHYIKGIDVLLETAALLREKEVNFTWEVIGEGTKQDMERYLYHRYQLGLENRVHFTGKQPHQEAVKAIAHSDVYVQTSLTEGFCNSVLEAQACGTIPIAFATGGLLENIKNGQTGFLVEAISADALSTKIIEVLSLKMEEKKKISRQAVERVKQEFTIENQQQEFIDFYS
ncbi:MAG TPA: glycosyltransferase, partial [Flavobacteriaceae bacterium]|nr:glycosyltransferase [Flavobacteriaceae bacterium]